MRFRVGGIFKLPRYNAVFRLVMQFFRTPDRPGHALVSRREHKLGTVSAHKLAAFNTHGFRHGDHDLIAARNRHGAKPDAGVAGGRFDDRAAGLQHTAAFGVIQNGYSDTVFGTARRVKIFELEQQARRNPPFTRQANGLEQRRIADKLREIIIYFGHKNTPFPCTDGSATAYFPQARYHRRSVLSTEDRYRQSV